MNTDKRRWGKGKDFGSEGRERNLRAYLKTTRGAVFAEKAGWRGATKENIPRGSSTEEQRSRAAFSTKTLRAAGLLSVAGVGSVVTARYRDAPPSPPMPQKKSLAASPLVVFKQALNRPNPYPRRSRLRSATKM
jgi:hypothetical protein